MCWGWIFFAVYISQYTVNQLIRHECLFFSKNASEEANKLLIFLCYFYIHYSYYYYIYPRSKSTLRCEYFLYIFEFSSVIFIKLV